MHVCPHNSTQPNWLYTIHFLAIMCESSLGVAATAWKNVVFAFDLVKLKELVVRVKFLRVEYRFVQHARRMQSGQQMTRQEIIYFDSTSGGMPTILFEIGSFLRSFPPSFGSSWQFHFWTLLMLFLHCRLTSIMNYDLVFFIFYHAMIFSEALNFRFCLFLFKRFFFKKIYS